MFFVLSRILDVFFSPLIWVVILLVASLLLKSRIRRHFFYAAFIVLLLFSNGAVFNSVAELWEEPQKMAPQLHSNYRKVVVLGGMASENSVNGLPRFSQSSDRLWQGLWLLKTGKADTLILSGGRGTLFDKQKPEGELLKDYLDDIDLLSDQIIIESVSRNTYENAVETAKIFDNRGMSKEIILVSSAFHIPRARACFENQGFTVDVFPADPLTGVRPLQWKDFIIPSAGVMDQWGVLFREWAGILMYEINGYI
jgi:uncharacterized SAM-binding protein YcdF (DUF218 family)